MKVGDRVWYLPASIGYGYVYGVDRGIPAVVTGWTPKRVLIEFSSKDGSRMIATAVIAQNLQPRQPLQEPR